MCVLESFHLYLYLFNVSRTGKKHFSLFTSSSSRRRYLHRGKEKRETSGEILKTQHRDKIRAEITNVRINRPLHTKVTPGDAGEEHAGLCAQTRAILLLSRKVGGFFSGKTGDFFFFCKCYFSFRG